VTFPWNDDNNKAFSGIPPHVALLQEVTQIKDNQASLVVEYIAQMKVLLQQMGVDGGRFSETNLRNILDEFEIRLSRIGVIGTATAIASDPVTTRVEAGRTYESHCYMGSFKRVPIDWRFPRCGTSDLWRQWWIGDSVRNVPPLRYLTIADYKHIDKLPLLPDEEHGRTGKHKGKRRPATKILSDMKFLMSFVHRKVVDCSALETVICIQSVDRMFRAVSDVFSLVERDAQKRWLSVVHDIRNRKIT
jgi:hypothetical protein